MVQPLSHVSVTPRTAARQASISFTNSRILLRLMSFEWVMPSNHLILCCPPSPPALSLSQHQVFSNESAHRIWWPKYWSFSKSFQRMFGVDSQLFAITHLSWMPLYGMAHNFTELCESLCHKGVIHEGGHFAKCT